MSLGVWEMLIVLLIVLVIFGAGKLPKVMGDVGKGIKNFKAGLKDEEAAGPEPLPPPPVMPAQAVDGTPVRDRA